MFLCYAYREMDLTTTKPGPRDILGLTFIHIATVLVCQFLAIFFTQFLVVSSLVTSSLPVDFNVYNETDREKYVKFEMEKIENTMKTNPMELIKEYYGVATKESPWILFYERLLWAFAFLMPAYFILHRFLEGPIPDLKQSIGFSDVQKGVLGGIAIFLFANLVFYILEVLGYKPEMNIANKALLNGIQGNLKGLLWGIYSIALVTGLIEEVFFRGFLLHHFAKIGFARYGLYFTSLIFGFMHHSSDASISIALTLSLVGFGFGSLFIFTGNIWVPVMAHATYNTLVLIVAFFYGDMSV